MVICGYNYFTYRNLFLNDPLGLNKEPSPTSIKKHKQPSKLVTVRHIFHSLSAKYFVLTARNISR